MAKFDKQPFCQTSFVLAWHFFMHMLIVSVLYVQSIRELQLKLWYRLTSSLVQVDFLSGTGWLPLWYKLTSSLVQVDFLSGTGWLPLWYRLISSLVQVDFLSGTGWLPLWYRLISSLVQVDFLSGTGWLSHVPYALSTGKHKHNPDLIEKND